VPFSLNMEYENEENWGNLHPLLLPPVLDKISTFLSCWDIQKCRLVCKTWDGVLKIRVASRTNVDIEKFVSTIERKDGR